MAKTLTKHDIEILEQWWINKSRKNFFAYRQYIRYGNFRFNWFISDLSRHLQRFYLDLIDDKKPILIVQTPPQHGKSWMIADLISWISGKRPDLKFIYASFSEALGVRCNLFLQRTYDSHKFRRIFPETRISSKNAVTVGNTFQRNKNMLAYIDTDGYFRNTTVGGSVTGETMDVGIIDDPFKGREQANSETYRVKIWEWFTNDFWIRASENAGLIIIMTRWHKDDLVGRIQENQGLEHAKILNYPAIAIHDELHRKEGEPLFPELKSLEFIETRKSVMFPPYFEALYQGSPVVLGGNLFKDEHWKWWESLPPLKFKFIVADTAQKTKTMNDWTCFQCWGYGVDDCIYLLDMLHTKLESPELRKEAVIFYRKHNAPKSKVNGPTLRGMLIEDKSSGSGLIQELQRKHVKVIAVQRNVDKVTRSGDCIPEIFSGKVFLNNQVPGVGDITSQAREFPDGKFDDAIDTTMGAIEAAFLTRDLMSSLQAAMEADD